MEINNEETSKVYTQAEVDQLRADSDAQYESLRAEGAGIIAGLKGSVSPDAFLASQQTADNAVAAENAQLAKYFGVGSNSKLANDLARENPALYASLKKMAQKNGLIGKPLALPKSSAKAFGPV